MVRSFRWPRSCISHAFPPPEDGAELEGLIPMCPAQPLPRAPVEGDFLPAAPAFGIRRVSGPVLSHPWRMGVGGRLLIGLWYQAGPRSTVCRGRCRDTPASRRPECSQFSEAAAEGRAGASARTGCSLMARSLGAPHASPPAWVCRERARGGQSGRHGLYETPCSLLGSHPVLSSLSGLPPLLAPFFLRLIS